MTSALFVAALLVPLVLVALLAAAGAAGPARHRLRRVIVLAAPIAVAPALGLAFVADPVAPGGAGTVLEVPWLLLGTHFAVDVWSRGLLLAAGLLYGAALGSIGWVRWGDAERRLPALCGFLLVAYAGNIGTYLAADAVTFYLCFATMSFSAAGLVVHYRSSSAHRATRIYLVLSVLSETAILAALVLTVSAGGIMLSDAPVAVATSPSAGVIIGLLLFGFGVKAGTVPLHVWLPLAHPAAPPAASAVLSGAMVNAGVVGWLRFLPSTDAAGPHGAAVVGAAGWTLLVFALLGAFAAVVFGVLQDDQKVILAYSTISQLGFMGAVVAVGMIVPELRVATTAAAVIYAVHHGLAKGALFLGVPVLKHFGRGATGVIAVIGMVIAGLALAGAPFTSGALGKYVSKQAIGDAALAGIELVSFLALIATGSTVLLMRFAWVLWAAELDEPRRVDGEFLCWLAVVVAAVAVPVPLTRAWYSDDALAVSSPAWDAATVWDAVWPILLGIALGLAAWALAAGRLLPPRLAAADGSLVEPGDLVVPEERAWERVAAGGGRVLAAVHVQTASAAERWSAAWEVAARLARRLVSRAEDRLGHWESSGAAILLVLGLAVTVTFLGLIGGGGGA